MRDDRQKRGLLVRRGYALFFIALYVILAPIILLYAYGYRYDWMTQRIIRTGVLSITSSPSGATVSIDGKENGDRTPSLIQNLYPREYEVTISKDGFIPWVKRLRVGPNAATIVDDVVLFYDSPEIKTLATNNSIHQIISDDRDVRYFVTQEQSAFTVYTSSTEDADEISIVGTLTNEPIDIIPSPNGQQLIAIVENGTFYLLSTDNVTTSPTRFYNPVDTIVWHDNQQYFVIQEGSLAAMSTDPPYYDASHVDTRWLTLSTSEDGIIGIHDDGDSATIRLITIDDDMTVSSMNLVELPELISPILLTNNRDTYVVGDTANRNVYLIDDPFGRPTVQSLGAVGPWAQWDNDNTHLILYSEFEIGVWDVDNLSYSLITRQSTPHEYVFWLGAEPYIFVASSGGLSVIDNDIRGGYRTDILSTDIYHDVFLSEDGKIVYAIADGQLVSLTIRP